MGNLCGKTKEESVPQAAQEDETTSLLHSKKQPVKQIAPVAVTTKIEEVPAVTKHDEQVSAEVTKIDEENEEITRKRIQQAVDEEEELARLREQEEQLLAEQSQIIDDEERARAEEEERLRLQEEELLREQEEQLRLEELQQNGGNDVNVRASVQLEKELDLLRMQEEMDEEEQRQLDERKRKRDALFAQMNGTAQVEQQIDDNQYENHEEHYDEQYVDENHHQQYVTYADNHVQYVDESKDQHSEPLGGTDTYMVPPPPPPPPSITLESSKPKPTRMQSEIIKPTTDVSAHKKSLLNQSAPNIGGGISQMEVERTRSGLRPSIMRNKEEDVWKNVFK